MSKTPIPLRVKIDSLLFRAWTADIDAPRGIICDICLVQIDPGDEIDWDHHVPEALGGVTTYANVRPLHRACHRKKTSGTKATSAGSDVHMISKAKRISTGGKKRRGRKMEGPGFQKIHCPMRKRYTQNAKQLREDG